MESWGMTNPRWEVESFFDGFGGALFDLYCKWFEPRSHIIIR